MFVQVADEMMQLKRVMTPTSNAQVRTGEK